MPYPCPISFRVCHNKKWWYYVQMCKVIQEHRARDPIYDFCFKFKNGKFSSGWCGSVDWALAYEPKGRQFNSQSGHMPRMIARSPVRGAWEATTHGCFSPSLSPSLTLFLKINKIFLKTHMIISIDTEKAFDKIQHPFMIKNLRSKVGIQGIEGT